MKQNNENQGKVIVFSAPSGAGKTSIVRSLLDRNPSLSFSISACSRKPRPTEIDGKDYFFMQVNEFKEHIEFGKFLEWEEVYKDHFYGTLKSELNRIWSDSKTVIFDVDVKGGINIKNLLGSNALSVFVMPPSIEELESRLRLRKTETEEKIQQRVLKASVEMEEAKQFDVVLKNDNLDQAINEAMSLVHNFIKS